MIRRAVRIDRETQGAIDFDAALETYVAGCEDPEELLRAAGNVLGSTIPLDLRSTPRLSPSSPAAPTCWRTMTTQVVQCDAGSRCWGSRARGIENRSRGINRLDREQKIV
jgi:hypothetical protein